MLDISQINSLSIKKIKELCSKYENNIKDFCDDEEFNRVLTILKQDERKGVQDTYKKLFRLKDHYIKELNRVQKLYDFDKSFNVRYIAGVDEVGRGPLAGPIVAAAVILDLNLVIEYINDSKKIVEEKREELSEIIKRCAIDYNISEMSNEEIDSKGIGFCNNQIFIKAVEGLKIKPDLVLSDGYLIKNWNAIENKHVIKGDAKSASIACASIIAKVYRDALMKEYSEQYHQYNFKKNVGYGTQEHVSAIRKYGICPIHRKTFLTKLNE
ncbi:ribonuclease HII [Hathewaya limosa]|uniref:Ribonuclease HII n=1 Tax=Hathewaya limosa TaxID=1536 RepID=A0ABU0JPL5_HATLI|nr:ribonuclease HII [Hathewaya limosa]AWZ48686.1 ribonuclease HII [Clostridiaceae bacterium 14S0207]MDQ0479030.1 ribonuclease HII [Hathewaya limosa]